MTSTLPQLIVIAGPTASGKTEQALALARKRHGEIISVDSRQVYRYLSVGTAKPVGTWSKETYLVEGIPYHLVDFMEPDQSFSAANFVLQAEKKIQSIRKKGCTPMLVGGTGLYFKALFEGLAELPPADPAIRETLSRRAESEGRATLHRELGVIDPAAAAAIPANNIQRVIRALEVYQLTGKPISQWHRDQPKKAAEAREVIILDPGKEELDRRIEARCNAMVRDGMIEETQALLKRGAAKKCPALSGLGYPHVVSYLENEISRKELVALLLRDTRQYVKRQRTWFRHQKMSDAA